MLTLIQGNVTDMYVIATLFILGSGCGMCIPIATTAIQNVFAHSRMGVVTSTLQFARNLGSTIGVSIFGMILDSGLKSKSYATSLQQVFVVATIIALIGVIFAMFLKEKSLKDTVDI